MNLDTQYILNIFSSIKNHYIVISIITAPWVACVSSPCDNGVTCVDVNIDTFVCLCRDGYYGETCQYSKSLHNFTEYCADLEKQTSRIRKMFLL